MKNLTNKIFTIEDQDYKILVDGRNGSGSIGHGVVMFHEADKPLPEDGSLYSLSGSYFFDNAPYFHHDLFLADQSIQEAL